MKADTTMKKPDLYLVGIGDDGLESLPLSTKKLLLSAATVFGGKRHLDMLKDELGAPAHGDTKTVLWQTPIKNSLKDIQNAKTPVVILASGEPMWHGIGRLLHAHFPADSIYTLPSVGSFSLCCARLGWQLEDVTTISLHNCSASYLLRYLRDDQKIIMLTKNKATLSEVAHLLQSTPYADCPLYVLEHLGGKKENISKTTSRQYMQTPFPVSDLYCMALLTSGSADVHKKRYPLLGIQDDDLYHDGKLTKLRIRTITMADLNPRANAILWDIGAGCGSISVEWMRLGGKSYAIECHKERLKLLQKNAKKFGLEDMMIVEGVAPDDCENLPQPHSIFIGGGLSTHPQLLDFCYTRLASGGTLVANAVTLESEQALLNAYHHYGGELNRIAIADAKQVGTSSLHGWKPSMPITHYVLQKS